MLTSPHSSRPISPLIYGLMLVLVLGTGVVESKAREIVRNGPQMGSEVVLVRNCTAEEERNRGDGHPMFVVMKGNGKTAINDDEMTPAEVVSKLSEVFSHRQAKLAYLIADESVSYERVATMAANLQKATDGLYLLMPTVSQIRDSHQSCYMGPPRYWDKKFSR